MAIVSGKRWAIVSELKGIPEPNFEEVIASLEPADLIIVEGYKSAPIPKIEARRLESRTKKPLAEDDPLVVAIAADHAVEDTQLPTFQLNEITKIADFIDATVGPIGAKFRSSGAQHDHAGAASLGKNSDE